MSSARKTPKPATGRAKRNAVLAACDYFGVDPETLKLRIRDMDWALTSGKELTSKMRQEINLTLWLLRDILWRESEAGRRGAPRNPEVWEVVHIADELAREYEIGLEAAVSAAIPPEATTTVESVLKTYRAWRTRPPSRGAVGEIDLFLYDVEHFE